MFITDNIRYKYHYIAFLNLLSKMNKVFPIIEEENDCSASSIRSNSFKIEQHNLNQRSQKWSRTCKICLEEEFQITNIKEIRGSDSQLICPCDCKGSLKYVHSKCLIIWLVKQKNAQNNSKICCELCNSQIFFKSQSKPQCRCSWHNLKEIPKFNIASLLIQIATLILLAFFLWNFTQPDQKSYLKYVLLSFFLLTSIIFLLTIFWTAKQLFVVKIIKIEKIYSIEQCQKIGYRPNKSRISLTKQIKDSFYIRIKKTKEKVRNSLDINPCNVDRIVKKRLPF